LRKCNLIYNARNQARSSSEWEGRGRKERGERDTGKLWGVMGRVATLTVIIVSKVYR
jgi:hypothetical protein